jgi:hypothetical protein
MNYLQPRHRLTDFLDFPDDRLRLHLIDTMRTFLQHGASRSFRLGLPLQFQWR